MTKIRKSLTSAATVVVTTGLVVLGAGTAHAALVTGSFTGTVTSVQGGAAAATGILVGDPLAAIFSFNPFAPDTNLSRADTGNFKNSNGLMGSLSLTIGSLAWTATDMSILIFNNRLFSTSNADLFMVRSTVTQFPSGAPGTGGPGDVFFLLANNAPLGSTPDLVNSTALPTGGVGTGLNQVNFPGGAPEARGKIATASGGNLAGYRILFDIDNPNFNLNPVPEPGTLLLIGSGLVGIGVGARRKSGRK